MLSIYMLSSSPLLVTVLLGLRMGPIWSLQKYMYKTATVDGMKELRYLCIIPPLGSNLITNNVTFLVNCGLSNIDYLCIAIEPTFFTKKKLTRWERSWRN